MNMLMSIFLVFNLYGQTELYPILSQDSLGNDIVIMTVQQANRLDNLSTFGVEMALLYDDLSETDSLCQDILNEKDSLIVYLNESIMTKDSINDIQRNQLSNLNNQIYNLMLQDSLYRIEISNKDEEIGLKDDKINDLKVKGLLSGSLNILALIATLILL